MRDCQNVCASERSPRPCLSFRVVWTAPPPPLSASDSGWCVLTWVRTKTGRRLRRTQQGDATIFDFPFPFVPVAHQVVGNAPPMEATWNGGEGGGGAAAAVLCTYALCTHGCAAEVCRLRLKKKNSVAALPPLLAVLYRVTSYSGRIVPARACEDIHIYVWVGVDARKRQRTPGADKMRGSL